MIWEAIFLGFIGGMASRAIYDEWRRRHPKPKPQPIIKDIDRGDTCQATLRVDLKAIEGLPWGEVEKRIDNQWRYCKTDLLNEIRNRLG